MRTLVKKLLASTCLAGALVTLAAVPARAEPIPAGITILDTVDGVTTVVDDPSSGNEGYLRVEGIVAGQTQAREFDLPFYYSSHAVQTVADHCMKLLLISQAHPGRYTVIIKAQGTGSSILSCKLKSR